MLNWDSLSTKKNISLVYFIGVFVVLPILLVYARTLVLIEYAIRKTGLNLKHVRLYAKLI